MDSPVLILTDNTTVVAALRTRNSQALPLQDLVEEINALEQTRIIEIVTLHIPGQKPTIKVSVTLY